MNEIDRWIATVSLPVGVSSSVAAAQLHDWPAGRWMLIMLAFACYYLVVEMIAKAIGEVSAKKCNCTCQHTTEAPQQSPTSNTSDKQ